jgi:hypothetical protein
VDARDGVVGEDIRVEIGMQGLHRHCIRETPP